MKLSLKQFRIESASKDCQWRGQTPLEMVDSFISTRHPDADQGFLKTPNFILSSFLFTFINVVRQAYCWGHCVLPFICYSLLKSKKDE